MKQFSDYHKLSKFTQDEIDNTHSPKTITEIDLVIKKIPQGKSSDPDSFTREFYQSFIEESALCSYTLFWNITEEVIVFNSSNETSVTLT